MINKNCDRHNSVLPLAKRYLHSTLGILALSTAFFLSTGVNKSEAKIIDSVTEDIKEGHASMGDGGSSCNKLENVTTFMGNTAHPVRAGQRAFRHWINNCGNRSELSMKKTVIGNTYWYGWSIYIPSDWKDSSEGFDIFAQWATYPTPRNGKFTCGANGSYMVRNRDTLIFKFQHKGDKADIQCDRYNLVTIPEMRGKWVDFVMQANWTGDTDGFLKLWMKVGNGSYTQKVDYKGRTFWNDEGSGPYFKMGEYQGNNNAAPSPRYLYTDEYRMGDASSSFAEVAPSGSKQVPTPQPESPQPTEKEPQPETQPAKSTVFEDFATSASNFTVESGGDWSVGNGKYLLANTNSKVDNPNGNISVHQSSLANNFTLTADASATASSSAWDDFSIIFNYQDLNNYYFASFNEKDDDQTNGIFKVAGGVATQLINFDSTIQAGTNYKIQVEKTGDTIKVYQDGKLQATAKDSSFSGGKFGVGSRNNPATFDNLQVK